MVVGDLNVCPHITPTGYKKLEEGGLDLALRLQNECDTWSVVCQSTRSDIITQLW